MTLHGAGHGLPQAWARHPRLLGPSLTEPNGPALIWAFFARQALRNATCGGAFCLVVAFTLEELHALSYSV